MLIISESLDELNKTLKLILKHLTKRYDEEPKDYEDRLLTALESIAESLAMNRPL